MNTNQKELIVQLLLHDMRHHQLLAAITNLGFVDQSSGSDLLVVIAGLMGIAEDDISDKWGEAYMSFIMLAMKQKAIYDDDRMSALACNCYDYLQLLVDNEPGMSPTAR